MKKILLSLIIFCICATTGCDVVQKSFFPKKEKVQPAKPAPLIEDVDLAKAIIWPSPKEIKFNRDIFRPLVSKEGELGEMMPGTNSKEDLDVSSLSLLAIYFSENPLALIKRLDTEERVIVRQNDRIENFVIIQVNPKEVILEKDGKQISLKFEGDEK